MPNPKHRHSKARTGSRRANFKAIARTTTSCSNCGASVLSHRVCPECGYYRGKLAIAPAEATA